MKYDQMPKELKKEDVGVWIVYYVHEVRKPEELVEIFKCSKRTIQRKLKRIRLLI
jgi:hypothetical protein